MGYGFSEVIKRRCNEKHHLGWQEAKNDLIDTMFGTTLTLKSRILALFQNTTEKSRR